MGLGPVRAEPAKPAGTLKRRWLRRAALAAALGLVGLVALLWFAPEWLLTPLASYLDVSEPPRMTDHALVLNGDPQTRPFAAAALFKTGMARRVLLTRQKRERESATVQDGAMPSELELTKFVLRARGVPNESVEVLPDEIENTVDEAQALAHFLDDNPGQTVSVVTNGFHTRRARQIFGRVLGERIQFVHFVGVPRDGVDAAAWWRTKQGCVVYVSEYAKLFYYSVR